MDGSWVAGQTICELGGNQSLSSLNVSGTKITSLECIDQFPNLTNLNIVNTTINDISIINKLTKLESLNLYRTEIQNFDVISKLNELRKLIIPNVDIPDTLLKNSGLIEQKLTGNRARIFYRVTK